MRWLDIATSTTAHVMVTWGIGSVVGLIAHPIAYALGACAIMMCALSWFDRTFPSHLQEDRS